MAWNDKEIKYLKALREESDLDWKEITEEMNEQFTEHRTLNATRKAYRRFQDDDVSDDTLIKNIKTTHTAKKTASKLRKENKTIVENLVGFDDVIKAIDNSEKYKHLTESKLLEQYRERGQKIHELSQLKKRLKERIEDYKCHCHTIMDVVIACADCDCIELQKFMEKKNKTN